MAWILLPMPAQAKIRGRISGDFSIGGGYDDSVFRDASKRKDGFGSGSARLGWGGRLTRTTIGRLGYSFRTQVYARQTRETWISHTVEGMLRQRLLPRLSLEAPVSVLVYRQPKLTDFNFLQWGLEPGLRLSPLDNTRLEAAFVYEDRSYPNFDLDRRGPGFSAGVAQDIGLNLSLMGRYRQIRWKYTERALFKNAAGEKDSELRRETDREAEIGFRYELGPAGLWAGYEWTKLSSNGNFLDFGPNQSSLSNTTAGDDRLVSNYYSYLGQGPVVRLAFRSGALSLIGSFQWEGRTYEGRIAKNSSDLFAAGDPLRRDVRRIYTVSIGRMRRTGKILAGFVADLRHENSVSNDSLYTFKNYSAAFSFRIGF